jgi:hypothetical protein
VVPRERKLAFRLAEAERGGRGRQEVEKHRARMAGGGDQIGRDPLASRQLDAGHGALVDGDPHRARAGPDRHAGGARRLLERGGDGAAAAFDPGPCGGLGEEEGGGRAGRPRPEEVAGHRRPGERRLERGRRHELAQPVGHAHRRQPQELEHVAAAQTADLHGALEELPARHRLDADDVDRRHVEEGGQDRAHPVEGGAVAEVAVGVGAEPGAHARGLTIARNREALVAGQRHHVGSPRPQLEPVLLERQLADRARPQAGGVVQDAGAAVAGMELDRRRDAAGRARRLEHHHLVPLPGQEGGAGEAVEAGADDDAGGHGWPLTRPPPPGGSWRTARRAPP